MTSCPSDLLEIEEIREAKAGHKHTTGLGVTLKAVSTAKVEKFNTRPEGVRVYGYVHS